MVSAPDPGLATAASDAVKQWEYTPTLLNCAPIEVRMGVSCRSCRSSSAATVAVS